MPYAQSSYISAKLAALVYSYFIQLLTCSKPYIKVMLKFEPKPPEKWVILAHLTILGKLLPDISLLCLDLGPPLSRQRFLQDPCTKSLFIDFFIHSVRDHFFHRPSVPYKHCPGRLPGYHCRYIRFLHQDILILSGLPLFGALI